jgi:predicted Fe-Mo cluster-binding NifX family protein
MIAVPATGPSLEARVDPRFGRCACFLVVDPETLEFELRPNTAAMEVTGAGPAAARILDSAGISAVVASGLGVNAIQVLRSAGIEAYRVSAGTVRQAVESYRSGALSGWSPTEPPDELTRLKERAHTLRGQLEDTERRMRELERDENGPADQGMTTSSSSRTKE